MNTPQSTFTVAGLAGHVGVKPDTIRYYERIGLLPPARRTPADYRRYDSAAIDRLHFIQGAKRLGLRLADIRQLLELRESGECPCEPAATLLRRRLAEIDQDLSHLLALREDLQVFVDRIPAENCPDPLPGTWRPREEVSE